MAPTPTLNGQVLGSAENASRAVLDRLLERTGETFHRWVVLNVTALAGGSIERAAIVERMTGALKIDEATARTVIADLIGSALLAAEAGEPAERSEQPARVGLTEAGWARYRQIRAGIDGIAARLYADIPAGDLATAGRVLTIITQRANAELAAG